ncbi:MAG: FxsA family protein [Spirochaetaceae bacterium]|nr:FxsA family protein [Spirochaetaceae bacterium]RKX80779.1 MAG: hypothetical protein DRP60_02370 [Spirochaetota bacterium]RKX90001.1 MAG: hypothetical protein DRP70_02105 [Spirochaetota bacterium]
MLNFRLLNILTDSRSVRTWLGIISALGAGVLLDVLLFLKLAIIIGPWITMTALALNTAAGIFLMNYLTNMRNRQLNDSIDSGNYNPEVLSRYLSSLVASLFIITPGFLNSLLGLVLFLPPVGIKIGNRIARMIGIDWQEAHEFLRLNRVAGAENDKYADG